jgi:hypothetical protein
VIVIVTPPSSRFCPQSTLSRHTMQRSRLKSDPLHRKTKRRKEGNQSFGMAWRGAQRVAVGGDRRERQRLSGDSRHCEGAKEDKAGRRAFLKHLKERGLNGVRLIISDACMGLAESAAEFFPDAAWQRCIVHWLDSRRKRATSVARPMPTTSRNCATVMLTPVMVRRRLHDEPRARVVSWLPLRPTRLRRERGSVVVVWPTAPVALRREEQEMQRVIGMDIHRTFAEVVFWEAGRLRAGGRAGR